MRTFETGATRDSDSTKIDPEGFLSPLVVLRYSAYMHKHRKQADGNLRDSDNWQKGMSLPVYMKSLWRHFLDVWLLHRGHQSDHDDEGYDLEEALCAMLFNVSGYLHELLKQPKREPQAGDIVQASDGTVVGFIASQGAVTADAPCINGTLVGVAAPRRDQHPTDAELDAMAKAARKWKS